MKRLILILLLTAPLGGCALIAAGVIGGIVAHDCDYYGNCFLLRGGGGPHPHHHKH